MALDVPSARSTYLVLKNSLSERPQPIRIRSGLPAQPSELPRPIDCHPNCSVGDIGQFGLDGSRYPDLGKLCTEKIQSPNAAEIGDGRVY
jgi:hypothetical protein